ncbi:hypothetical protein ACFYYB_27210 [Streptomyces sp. NPDC002886]
MDRKFKPVLYAKAGIRHHWRLELDPSPRLIISELADGRSPRRRPLCPVR